MKKCEKTLSLYLEEDNVAEAFRAAHTLKGVCQSLDFPNLYQPTMRVDKKAASTAAKKSDMRCFYE